jgi:hypothetical protein
MCAEASAILRAVAADLFFNCMCLKMEGDFSAVTSNQATVVLLNFTQGRILLRREIFKFEDSHGHQFSYKCLYPLLTRNTSLYVSKIAQISLANGICM